VLSLLTVPDGGAGTDAQLPVRAAGVAAALAAAKVDAPLVTVTCGAVAVGLHGQCVDPVQTAVRGAVQAAGSATADRAPRPAVLLDLPAAPDAAAWRHAAAALALVADGEDQVAVRSSGVFRRRLVPAGRAPRWTPSGAMLVTGLDTPFGPSAARWLAEHGAEHLVLCNVGGHGPTREKLTTELRDLGASVTLVEGDVAEAGAVAAAVADLPAGVALTAVFHLRAAFGTGGGDEVVARTAAALDALDAATAAEELSAFVVFTPLSGVVGLPVDATSAAAAAYLHGWVQRRRAAGRSALAVAWADPGAGVGVPGLRALASRSAAAVLGQAVADGDGTLVLADADWERFGTWLAERRPTLLLRGLSAGPDADPDGAPAGAPADAGAALRARLEAAGPAGHEDVLLELVHAEAALVLGYDSDEPMDASSNFLELGFSSFTVLELSNRLAAAGLELAPALFYEHPTLLALSGHLAARLRASFDPQDHTPSQRSSS
jgi:aryl carrier-like protein